MQFHSPATDIHVPSGSSLAVALGQVTHLGIGAHQDDLEFMAFHGIVECHGRAERGFGGVTCTDGGGSARSGVFAGFSDARMREVRRQEQRVAADIGGYACMIQFGYPSAAVRQPLASGLVEDLEHVLRAARAEVVYTHNLADKHATHVGVAVAAIHALRRLPAGLRPERVIGCEVWRDLDWLPAAAKVVMDVSGHEQLADALAAVFDSQIAGGKRYDLAVRGRRAAHATFHESHAGDAARQLVFGMELTPLVQDATLDIAGYVAAQIEQFRQDVLSMLAVAQA